MAFYIRTLPVGFFVLSDDKEVAGPFDHRGDASNWILQNNAELENAQRQKAEQLRREPGYLTKLLQQAIANPEPSPGRLPADDSRESTIAFEYYWQLRNGGKPPRLVTALAKKYNCSTDHVRKIRKEYSPLADKEHYDDDLLGQLHAQAIGNGPPKREPPPKGPAPQNQAQSLLIALLSAGPMLASEVVARSRGAGLSGRTLERAKASLGVSSVRIGRSWAWHLPQGRQKS